MKVIDFDDIKALNIHPETCVEWVEDAFKQKYTCYLPSKISTKIDPDIFFNTMPVYIPAFNAFGVKVVSRYPERKPSLLSNILLSETEKGETVALMDGSWITAMRTGAVAALTIKTLRSKHAQQYAFIGLGNTARATLLCLLSILKGESLTIRLLAYKEQEIQFMERFASFENVHFTICNTSNELIEGADVIVSCVTVATELIACDAAFKRGVLVVPVHTRGFQNCDLFFDKVFADDTNHVKDFQYFNKFKKFDELSKVLLGKNPGRECEEERILAYNIGIALHDIYFAYKVYNLIASGSLEIETTAIDTKFWV